MESQLPYASRVSRFTFRSISSLLIITFFSCSVFGDNRIPRNGTDQLALLGFKAKLIDPFGVLDSWNNTIHLYQWYGVTCGRRHQRVVSLNLSSHKLRGTVSPSIGNLTFLRILNLQGNSLHSRIPPEISRLSRLREFRLNNNSLEGPLPPGLSLCSNLVFIHLSWNKLEGNLPANLSSLSKLRELHLLMNNLTGPIPVTYGNLSSLEILSITLNNLDGVIPGTLGSLQNLNILRLGGNNFVGTIPSSLFNVSSLGHLDVTNNELTGSLMPDSGFKLPALQVLFLSANQFTGFIPKSLSNLSDLSRLDVMSNNFIGEVPYFHTTNGLSEVNLEDNHLGAQKADDLNFLCSLTNSTKLEILGIGFNNFGGKLPECISNLSTMTLKTLSFRENRISGGLPSSIGNFVNLEKLFVGYNQISGIIPPEIGYLENLKQMDLGWSGFSEQMPHTIGNLSKLTHLSLRSNSLRGMIPPSLSNCQNLLVLDLANNSLTGAIPPEIMGISSLSIYADFSDNNLTGKLPMEVGNLKNLGILALQNNRISGEIPSSLGSCIMMEHLYMQDNHFEGPIPYTLRSIKGIQELNLSNNRLSGQIPEFLENLNLTSLGLAFNEFEGPLPTGGVFRNASATSVVGNKNLCGGLPEFQLPRCNIKQVKKTRTMRSERIIIICSISGFLGLLLVLSLLYVFCCRKDRQTADHESSINGLLKVSYQDLLKATNGFSPSNFIGSGSFGSVFRAVVDWDQTVVAVKVLNLRRHGATKSFVAECEALRNIRHRNLVRIITACSSSDYQGNGFKALVYEFMVNGSVDAWLHPAVETNEIEVDAPRQLALFQRLNIAVDVACALDYLHSQCDTPIVHCDLKPSNVLLDVEMSAHVGDFGLVRFLPEATEELVSDPSSSIGVKGSFGYIAPEYGAGGEVSTHGDVYSCGILVLEMFTGRRPTDEIFTAGLNLHSFAKAALPENVSQIVDPFLLQEFRDVGSSRDHTRSNRHGGRLHKILECLVSIIRLGVVCSSESPRDRTNMADVTAALRVIQKELLQAVGRRD